MIGINKQTPDFKTQAYQNEEIIDVKLSDYIGKWVVVFFYPADFTFVCPTELEELADNYAEFTSLGVEILSVSTDTVYVHKAWHDSSKAIGKIKFPMLADPSGKISRMFGVYDEETGLAYRGTFIIDPDGILKVVEIHNNDIGRSAKELLRKIKAAKCVYEHEGVVCPAEWEPGKDVLTPSLELVGKI